MRLCGKVNHVTKYQRRVFKYMVVTLQYSRRLYEYVLEFAVADDIRKSMHIVHP